MCLIFLSLNDHPKYKLIVVANRDEFYNRQTSPAEYWSDNKNVLAGRDLEAGGTWMGITTHGKIAMVTNYRDLKSIKQNAPSRGKLVSDYLMNENRPLDYLNDVEAESKSYNGFNLIVGNLNELYYHSNFREGVSPIPPGTHGLSNHLLDTPWPKVRYGLKKFQTTINKNEVDPDELLDLMYNDRLASDDELPDTGVGLERERMLSSMFIKSPGYGSRSSTVVLMDKKNNAVFVERTYDVSLFTYTSRQFSFQLTNL